MSQLVVIEQISLQNRNTSNFQSQSQFFRQNNNLSNDFRSKQEYQSQDYENRNFQSQSRIYYDEEKKNYDIIVNENKNYQKKYHDELKYDVIVNETKFVNEKSKYNEKAHNYFVKTLIKQIKIYICRRCSIEFYFNNKFHKYIKFCKNSLSIKNKSTIIDEFHVFVIQSNVALYSQSKLKFRFWRYVIITIAIDKIDNFNEICVDNECNVSLINRLFLIKKLFIYQKLIKQKLNVIKIRDIENVIFNIKNYLSLIFRVSKLTSNEITFTIVYFTRHVYIIDNLKTKILLSNDILKSKQIILNLNKKKWLLIIVKIVLSISI